MEMVKKTKKNFPSVECIIMCIDMLDEISMFDIFIQFIFFIFKG